MVADFLSIDDVCSATISTCVLKYAVKTASQKCPQDVGFFGVFFFIQFKDKGMSMVFGSAWGREKGTFMGMRG